MEECLRRSNHVPRHTGSPCFLNYIKPTYYLCILSLVRYSAQPQAHSRGDKQPQNETSKIVTQSKHFLLSFFLEYLSQQ